ncbi:MAG: hypothetical protein DRQ88_12375 [Epsilonproteobacteria bacterium]|nr:MAG: hypothetical protein DRQ88_12375 [Campylobacterota bacterium]
MVDLECKIKAKYLDEMLKGSKREAFQQFDTVLFVDERGRRVRYEIDHVFNIEYAEDGFRLGEKVIDDEKRNRL